MTKTNLADEAGIGAGTAYLYFSGKADVALAVLERLPARVRLRLREIAESSAEPADKLHEMLTARLKLLYESAHGHRHQTDELKRALQAAVEERRVGWMAAETDILAGVLEEGRHTGAFGFCDAHATAEALVLATSCMTPRNISQSDFEHPEAFREKSGRIIALLLGGLKHGTQVSSGPAQGNVCKV